MSLRALRIRDQEFEYIKEFELDQGIPEEEAEGIAATLRGLRPQ